MAQELKVQFHTLFSVVPWSEGRMWVQHTELTGGTKRLLAQNRAEPLLHPVISQSVDHTSMSFASLGSISI